MKLQWTGIFLAMALLATQNAWAGPELSATWQATVEPLGGSTSNIRFDVVVTNSGDQSANDVWFELFIGLGNEADLSASVDEAVKDAIPAGGEHYFTVNSGPLVAGSYTAQLQVDSLENNDELDEENNTLITQVTVVAPEKGYVDLVAVDLLAAVTDSNVQFTATIRNDGTGISAPFSADVFCGEATAPPAGSHGYPYVQVDPLAPGETREVEFQLVNKLEGSVPCFLMVDIVKGVPETNEDNNAFGPYVLQVPAYSLSPLPDIIVLDVEPTVGADGVITYATTFYNAGSSPVSNFRAQIFYDSDNAPEFGLPTGDANFDFILNDTFNQEMLPGSTRIVNWKWTEHPAEGEFKAWVYADTNNTYAEANENNNQYGPVSVNLLPAVGEADLYIDNVTSSVEGYSVRYTVTIGNSGTATPGAFDVDIFADSTDEPQVTGGATSDAYTTVSSGPAPGQTQDVEVIWNDASAGAFSSWAIVDAYQQVSELNETNNGFGPVGVDVEEVGGPELTITSFEGNAIGGNGAFTVTIANQGTLDAGAFDVSLYWESGTEPTESDTPDETVRVADGLAVDDTTVESITWENVPAGSSPVWVRIDSSSEIEEANENNNLEGPVIITVDEANCPDGTFLQNQCICGGTAQQTGYCCSGSWSALPCDFDEVEDQEEEEEADTSSGESEEDEEADTGSGENIEVPASDDGGCQHRPNTPLVLFGLIFLMTVVMRRSSAAN